jgi:lipopolysaccharide biosynthesis glycosyltransferase
MSEPVLGRPESLAGLAVHMLFRGDRTQLLQWCNFHLTVGVERLFVVLDCPSSSFLDSLPDHPRIDWQAVDQATWDSLYPTGSSNFERKLHDAFRWTARRAAAQGYGHLAFIDADELLHLAQPFSEISARFPDASALTVPVREMWFAQDEVPNGPFSATLGLRSSSPRAIHWDDAVGWRAQFLRNGVLGHDAGKSIYRLPLVSGRIGSHHPLGGALGAARVTLPAECGSLLHFDSGDLPIWNQKWGLRLLGETVAVKVSRQRQAQELVFAHALRRPPEEQAAFFREFYSLAEGPRALLAERGILARVDVSEELEGPLEVGARSGDALELRRLPPIADRVDFQFALVCDQRFVQPTFATMSSVLSHMGGLGTVRFVVLGDGLRADDVAWLKELEQTRYDVRVIVHDITADLDRDVGTEDLKRATFGRIYLVDYLPEQRTIYLDGDVLATRPFPELFQADLGTAALAGVTDSAALRMLAEPSGVPLQQRNRLVGITGGDPAQYLNGGVLIFDLDNPDFRDLALRARSLVVLQGHTLQQRDQDALNLAFVGRKHLLPSTYNYMTQFYVSERALDGDLAQRKYQNADASLAHFSGKVKPWLEPTDEFYNGLYRRLVSAAEDELGVSCGFYFSRPEADREDWTVERWVDHLGKSPGRLTPEPMPPDDIELVEVGDDLVYLRLSPSMYELATSTGLRLVAYAQGQRLFDLPLGQAGPHQLHMSERVGPGVRVLPLDLRQALATSGGVASDVELVVIAPDANAQAGFVRSLGVLDLLATGPRATPDLLHRFGVDGALEKLSEGWLTGWVRTRSEDDDAAVSLFVDGELAARRILPAGMKVSRSGLGRPFKFFAANIVRLGYGNGGEISIRFSGTNVPLSGGALAVADVGRNLRYDPQLDTWVRVPTGYRKVTPSSLARRLRSQLRAER